MSEPLEVVINGVRYVPAVTENPKIYQVLLVLAEQFWGVGCVPGDGFADMKILVSDGLDDDQGETFEELAARLSTFLVDG